MTRIIAILTTTALVVGLSSASAQHYPYHRDSELGYASSPSYPSRMALDVAAETDVAALDHYEDTNDVSLPKVAPEPKSVSKSARYTQGGRLAHRPTSVARTAEATGKHDTKEVITAVDKGALPLVSPLAWLVTIFFGVVSLVAMFLLWNIASQVSLLNQTTDSSDNNALSRRVQAALSGRNKLGNRPSINAPASAFGTIPKVVVSRKALDTAFFEIQRLSRQMPGDEVGCTFVGRVDGEGPSRTLVLNSILTEGENVTRSSGHHDVDRQTQQRELTVLQAIDPQVGFMGDLHLHPGSMTQPSGGDYRTDVRNVKESATQELILGIFTRDSRHGEWDSSKTPIHQNGFRLDLYYMGVESGFEYVPIRVCISDETPMLTASSVLADFVRSDPVRAQLDFAALRRLPNYEEVVFSTFPIEDSARELPCVQLEHRRGYKATVVLDTNHNVPPSVFVEIAGEVISYEPDFLKTVRIPAVWLTQIALELEKEFDASATETEPKAAETPTHSSSARLSPENNGRHRHGSDQEALCR